MERDRIAAGGAIDSSDQTNQITVHFNTLHNRSERIEGIVMLLGVVTVVLMAWAETARS
jgi:hypothetical protein